MSHIHRIPSPNPQWKPQDPIPAPFESFDSLQASSLASTDAYKLLIGSVVPRPIAFVSTLNSKGEGNLAPFSFFNAVGSNPPSIMFSVTKKADGNWKDTALNILDTKEFVVNSVSRWMAEPMNHCAVEYPHGVSELEKAGFTPLPSKWVKPPRIKEAAIQMECKLYKNIQVGNEGPGTAMVIIGEILGFHFGKGVLVNGKINIEALDPIARLAGFDYSSLSDVFEIVRKTKA